MEMNSNDTEPFDPLSEGRAGDSATHTPLHQRGRVLQQLREEIRRRESYSLNSRRVSSALLAQQVKKPRESTRRLLLGTTTSIAENIATLAPASVQTTDADVDTLVRSAVVALWTNIQLARGFRQWREVAKAPTDVTRFGSDTDLTIEARRILLAAETARHAALHDTKTADDGHAVVLSPRVLDTAGVRLTRDELDLLTIWAKEIHAKTFRGVDDASLGEVMRCLRLRTYDDGEQLFYEGETGETFYIIFQGTVGVFVGMAAATKATLSSVHRENKSIHLDWSQLGKRVFTYRSGDCFGETAMFSADATRTASAVAVGPCEICELHRDVYKCTLRKYHQQFFEQAQKLNLLQRIAVFRELPRHKLIALADVLEKKRFHFGETLGTTYRACFLMLSGVVKLTETVDVPGQSHALTPAEAALTASITNIKKKKKTVAHMKIELQTVVSNEIVGLEALVDPSVLPVKPHYMAIAASAHVDVYVLKEIDARGFVGSMNSALGQKIQRICATETSQRECRRHQTLRTMLQNVQDTEDLEAIKPLTRQTRPEFDSVDLAAAAPTSPRLHEATSAVVPGLRVNKQSPGISEGEAPYLPHLRATHLFPSTSLGFVVSPRDPTVASTDVSVVSSPKMLSSCVRKFLFEHSDTLANDYVERLRLQFPSPTPPQSLLLAGSYVASKTEREDRRVLMQHLSKMYDSKMHWDARKKEMIVTSATPTTISPRIGFLSSTPRAKSDNDVVVAPPPRDVNNPLHHASARRKSRFHQELKATQRQARQLVENHLQRAGGASPSSNLHSNNNSDTNSGGASYLHFFSE